MSPCDRLHLSHSHKEHEESKSVLLFVPWLCLTWSCSTKKALCTVFARSRQMTSKLFTCLGVALCRQREVDRCPRHWRAVGLKTSLLTCLFCGVDAFSLFASSSQTSSMCTMCYSLRRTRKIFVRAAVLVFKILFSYSLLFKTSITTISFPQLYIYKTT